MITTLDLARLQARVYQLPQAGWWTRVQLDEGPGYPWAWASLQAATPGSDLLIFRGSVTLADWYEDTRGQARIEDGRLGVIPAGFAFGLDVCHQGLPSLANPIIVGHSLGAARASLLAALRIYLGLPVRALVLFGSPRSGAGVSKLLERIGFVRSYKNLADKVCGVPLGAEWTQPVVQVQLGSVPTNRHLTLDLLADHHIDLYVAALAAELLEWVG